MKNRATKRHLSCFKAYDAGFLYGLALDQDLETCGRLGCAVAGEVIRHMGPRPKSDLKEVIAKQGLLNSSLN